MNFTERLAGIVKSPEPEVLLKPGVLRTLEVAHVDEYIADLEEVLQPKIERQIIEHGNRLVINIDWESKTENLVKRVILSVREGTIGFIGNDTQFIRLGEEDLKSQEMVENALLHSFRSPFIFTRPQA